MEDGVEKWNIATIGFMVIENEEATITSKPPEVDPPLELKTLMGGDPNTESPVRADGMPASKTERQLRRMMCLQRHAHGAYMDDGEASFGGDQFHRGIDYMRESPASIEKAWREAGLKRWSAEQEVISRGASAVGESIKKHM